MRAPAYAKALMARRRRGERIGWLVVAVHDWHAGEEFTAHAEVARVVLPPDSLPHELDWSCAVALDCLVSCAEGNEAVFDAALTMLQAAGAASLWGWFAEGIALLEPFVSKYRPPFVSVGDAVPPALFKRALSAHRSREMMMMTGVYGTPAFDTVRQAEYARVFGPAAEKVLAWVKAKREARAA